MKNKEASLMEKTVGYVFENNHSGTATVSLTFSKDRGEELLMVSHNGTKIRVPYYVVERLAKAVREKYKKGGDEPLPGQMELMNDDLY